MPSFIKGDKVSSNHSEQNQMITLETDGNLVDITYVDEAKLFKEVDNEIIEKAMELENDETRS